MLYRLFLSLLGAIALASPARAAHMMHADAEATVAILMFDGVQIIDFAAPYEVFGQAHFNVYTVSADGKPVTTAMGLNVVVDHGFADAPAADIVLVPGGEVDAARRDASTLDWLRERSVPAGEVLSVCTGAFILADAGLLDGKRATTFHNAFSSFEREYPSVTLVTDQRWVDNGKVITSAGLASGIDAALHVVARRLGERRARAIALHLEYDWSPHQGFVRGLMADRYLRMPEQDPDFPEGTRIRKELELGDEERWEIDYRVESPLGPEELLARITAMARADDGLTVLEQDSALATGWRYETKQTGQWQLLLRAEASKPGESYRVTAILEPVD